MSNILVELSNEMATAAEKVGESTARVNARRRIPATGIAYAKDLIITANHVVERDENITVSLSDGKEIPATLVGRDPGTDLALLRLKSPSAKPAETTPEAKVGQLVLALGRPSNSGIEASLGVVSAVGGPIHSRHGVIDKYIRTDTIPFPGFSGGPLADAEGRVIGLNTSGFGHGAALTIPADLVWRVAEQIEKHGSVQRGYLGVRSQGVDIAEAAQNALKRKQATGLLLVGIEAKSPAEAAELMVGDIMVAINKRPVHDHEGLLISLSGELIGKSTRIEVLRGGQPMTINVKIEARG